jgi:hypothetical protein
MSTLFKSTSTSSRDHVDVLWDHVDVIHKDAFIAR